MKSDFKNNKKTNLKKFIIILLKIYNIYIFYIYEKNNQNIYLYNFTLSNNDKNVAMQETKNRYNSYRKF